MSQKTRILLVDDEADIRSLLSYNLKIEGYDVVEATNGREAISMAETSSPDLIVLDIMMPVLDGFQACRILREHDSLSATPILMLTAKTGEGAHVEGLDVGADAYLAKPVSLPVLFSQIRALLRGRSRDKNQPPILKVRDIVVDRSRYVVVRNEGDDEEKLRLPRKEFDLLFYLATNPGRVFSRQEILDEVWGQDVFVVDRTVDVHVRKIREKLGDDYIETVKGVGYRFTEAQ